MARVGGFGKFDVGVRSPAGSEVVWCFGASPEKVIDAVTELIVLQRNDPETWDGEIFIRKAPMEVGTAAHAAIERCLDDPADEEGSPGDSGGRILHLPVPGTNRRAKGRGIDLDPFNWFGRGPN